MSFSNDISKFNSKFEKAFGAVLTGTFLDLSGKIIKRSPIGKPSLWKSKYKPKGYSGGRFRANWMATKNNPSSKTTNAKDNSGRKANQAAKKIIAKYKISDSLFLINNLPYAALLEDGKHSKQAPQGMVKVTVAEFERVVKMRANKVK